MSCWNLIFSRDDRISPLQVPQDLNTANQSQMLVCRGSRLCPLWMHSGEAFKGGGRWCIGWLEDYLSIYELLHFRGEIPVRVRDQPGPTALGRCGIDTELSGRKTRNRLCCRNMRTTGKGKVFHLGLGLGVTIVTTRGMQSRPYPSAYRSGLLFLADRMGLRTFTLLIILDRDARRLIKRQKLSHSRSDTLHEVRALSLSPDAFLGCFSHASSLRHSPIPRLSFFLLILHTIPIVISFPNCSHRQPTFLFSRTPSYCPHHSLPLGTEHLAPDQSPLSRPAQISTKPSGP